jgi:hypothetical protein
MADCAVLDKDMSTRCEVFRSSAERSCRELTIDPSVQRNVNNLFFVRKWSIAGRDWHGAVSQVEIATDSARELAQEKHRGEHREVRYALLIFP